MPLLAHYSLITSVVTSGFGALVICLIVFAYGLGPNGEPATPRRVLLTRVAHATAGVCFAVTAILTLLALARPWPTSAPLASDIAAVEAPTAALRDRVDGLDARVVELDSRLHATQASVREMAEEAARDRRAVSIEAPPPALPRAALPIVPRKPTAVERAPSTTVVAPRQPLSPAAVPSGGPVAVDAAPAPQVPIAVAPIMPPPSVSPPPLAAAPSAPVPVPLPSPPTSSLVPAPIVLSPRMEPPATVPLPPPTVAVRTEPPVARVVPSPAVRPVLAPPAPKAASQPAAKPAADLGASALDLKTKVQTDWKVIMRAFESAADDLKSAVRRPPQ
jgi:hypothetical protein